MNTNHNNTSNSENILSQTGKEEILKRKQAEMISHIESFFFIGGLQMPCELLRDLLTDSNELAKIHPHAELDYDVVTTNVYYTTELMSFISILYQHLHEVKSAKLALSSND